MFDEDGDHALGSENRMTLLISEKVIGPATYAEYKFLYYSEKPNVTMAKHEQWAGSSEKLDITKSNVWSASEAIRMNHSADPNDPDDYPYSPPPPPFYPSTFQCLAEFLLNNDSEIDEQR